MAIIKPSRNFEGGDLLEMQAQEWRAFMRGQAWDAERWKSPLYRTIMRASSCNVPIERAIAEVAEFLPSVGVTISKKALEFHSNMAWGWTRQNNETESRTMEVDDE